MCIPDWTCGDLKLLLWFHVRELHSEWENDKKVQWSVAQWGTQGDHFFFAACERERGEGGERGGYWRVSGRRVSPWVHGRGIRRRYEPVWYLHHTALKCFLFGESGARCREGDRVWFTAGAGVCSVGQLRVDRGLGRMLRLHVPGFLWRVSEQEELSWGERPPHCWTQTGLRFVLLVEHWMTDFVSFFARLFPQSNEAFGDFVASWGKSWQRYAELWLRTLLISVADPRWMFVSTINQRCEFSSHWLRQHLRIFKATRQLFSRKKQRSERYLCGICFSKLSGIDIPSRHNHSAHF